MEAAQNSRAAKSKFMVQNGGDMRAAEVDEPIEQNAPPPLRIIALLRRLLVRGKANPIVDAHRRRAAPFQ